MSNERHIAQAVAILLASSVTAGCAAQVAAAKRAEAIKRGAPEMCYAVARGGRNDCRTAAHVCAGWAHKDADPGAFVYLPAGTCERIAGGRLEPESTLPSKSQRDD